MVSCPHHNIFVQMLDVNSNLSLKKRNATQYIMTITLTNNILKFIRVLNDTNNVKSEKNEHF